MPDRHLPDDFDPQVYLMLHADVAAAKLDAGYHYLAYGHKEGRPYKAGSPSPVPIERPVFFCHIPKTAGTTLRLALEAAFPAHTIMPDRLMMARAGGHYPPPALVASTMHHQKRTIRFLRGHYHYSCRNLLDNPLTIVVLREPVARVLSHIPHNIQANGLSIVDAVASIERGVLPGVPDNQMTRYLGGKVSTNQIGKSHDELMLGPIREPRGRLSSAMENAAGVDILGFDTLDSIAPQLQRIGVTLQQGRRDNVSGVSIDLTERHREIIADLNALDVELYKETKGRAGLL